MLQRDKNGRLLGRGCNSPSANICRSPGLTLALARYLGFNLKKISYLIVATFESTCDSRQV